MTIVERLASWASSLSLEAIPARTLKLLRGQRFSVLGGVAASAGDAASRRVLSGLGATNRPLDAGDSVEGAVYAGAVLSVALDFDDYVCFGHTGHSSVLVPLLLATETRADAERQLVAQVAANEVGARLGGSCLIGPLNGQLWSFIHAAEAALAGGLLLGLDEVRLAHALALSLHQPPRPSVPGFMAPDSKLLTAADPAVYGLRCARLAGAGVTGPLDVLDSSSGFLRTFSYAPLRGMFGGLGAGWATDTLSVKPYPGCAYVDPVIDALGRLGPPKADEVRSVHVHAGALTCGMEALSAEYAKGKDLTAVNINFSVGANVAIALLAGRVSPEELRADWLAEHVGTIRDLSSKVELHHDWSMTRNGSRAMAGLIPTQGIVGEIGRRRLGRALRRMRGDHRGVAMRIGDAPQIARWIRDQLSGSGRTQFWDPAEVDSFRMTLPARVEVELKSGDTAEVDIEVPEGACGNRARGPIEVAEEKFARWGPELWGDSGAGRIAKAIASDADELAQLVTDATL